ncbi:MAG: Na+/H+ antiporter subunit E [Gammaproteobacteria bacterium]|nr:Na+/H+ antiporter subunit E [Gammaproteobacteria bacterium]MBU1644782.1 Na+/H+ antiporter subunit E [Gammaproteobacteria bacterium]MBU1973015.1 Na+/H+ antiporter subunit E [Gammaproteobacteria bacterium]
MLRSLSLFLFLSVFWLLLSGMPLPFLLAAGVGSALAVVWFAHRLDVIDHEGHPAHLVWHAMLSYWPWLLKEIAVSGWQVTRVVLDPRLPISPTLVRMRPSQTTDVGLVTHANSITLTPGTISLEVGSDEFLVHALTRDGAAGVQRGGAMDLRVRALESRPEKAG